MITNAESLRKVQMCNLKNLKKLDEICRRHGLKYWAAYGTLIGTVRHQGFVPWDDDIDVEMLREDYLKLCEVPAEEWGDTTVFCSGYSEDERQDKVFGRVFQNNTRIQSYRDIEEWQSRKTGETWSTSVMLDIYVVEQIPDDDEEFRRLYDKIAKIRENYKVFKLKHKPAASLKKRIKYALLEVQYMIQYASGIKPWVKVMDDCRKLIARSHQGSRLGFYCTVDPNIYRREDFFPLAEMPYEDMMIPVPANYHKMLTDMYGDYMKVPPENERYHINFIYADLGDGTVLVSDPVKGSLAEGMEKNC